ncbi:MAG: extracellular solute-binding protein [Candidatus Dormibacteria bacterium]|jgi:raffinose/stachyose/melibiose transport system substrate-binding protein
MTNWIRRKQSALLVATLVAAAGLSAGLGVPAGVTTASAASGSVTHLTLWENYGTEANATVLQNLITAFEKIHPNIKIDMVSQPAANYFPLLQSAAISHTGPDLTVEWTGLFTLQYKSQLENLKSWVPASDLNRMEGLRWTANGFNLASGPYVIPLEDQFYIGYYNKALFAKMGITSPPKTWTELYADCAKFKAANITCQEFGNGTQNITAEFYPWYDMSYMMIGAVPLSKWQNLYNGSLSWTSKTVTAQLAHWATLSKDGYTNPDVLTSQYVLESLAEGHAAMVVDGNWSLAWLQSNMGTNVGVYVPPYSSNGAIHGVVQYPGDGISMTAYSQHKPQAAAFLKFMTTTQAASIVAAGGLIPDVKGATTSDSVSNEMLAFAAKDGYTVFPMLDNVTQPNVVNAGSTILPDRRAGQLTVAKAASEMEAAWKQLPKTQRGGTWASYKA